MKRHERVRELSRICEYDFTREDLAVSALTHPSAAEKKPVSASYERLEFLGDSLVGALVASYVYERFPSMDEGELSTIKTWMVSGDTLADVAGKLGIGSLIIFGKSERGTGARGMRKSLEDVYEAVVGALYLDGGIEAARAFVARTLFPLASLSMAERSLSPKSRLQEVTQRDMRVDPVYKLVGEEGPLHAPIFTSVVLVNGRRVGRGKGSTKKDSEAAAALDALDILGYAGERHNHKDGGRQQAAQGTHGSRKGRRHAS